MYLVHNGMVKKHYNNEMTGLKNAEHLFKYTLCLFQNNNLVLFQPLVFHSSLTHRLRATRPTHLDIVY